jgi:hypothetical protein
MMTASDNCGLREVLFSEQRINTSCPSEYLLIRMWTAFDHCNNSATAIQRITVIDTIAPILVGPPAVGPFQCPADVPSMAASLAEVQVMRSANESAECFDALTIVPTETRINGSCVNEFSLLRRFTVTDCAGNSASVDLTIVVHDTTPPVLVGVPAETSMPCDNITSAPTVTAWDNCDCPLASGIMCVPVTFNETRIAGRCTGEYTLIRRWIAIDSCGNMATSTQTIHVFDNSPPRFVNPPGPLNGTCVSIPTAQQLNALDNSVQLP